MTIIGHRRYKRFDIAADTIMLTGYSGSECTIVQGGSVEFPNNTCKEGIFVAAAALNPILASYCSVEDGFTHMFA